MGDRMIQMYTYLDVADNTGAKECMCIKVLGGTRRRYAGLGDIIVASVKKAHPRRRRQAGRRGQGRGRPDQEGDAARRRQLRPLRPQRHGADRQRRQNPRGTRIFGAVARELRERGFMKIVSLAAEVV